MARVLHLLLCTYLVRRSITDRHHCWYDFAVYVYAYELFEYHQVIHNNFYLERVFITLKQSCAVRLISIIQPRVFFIESAK